MMLLLHAPFFLTGIAFIVVEILVARSADLSFQLLSRLVDFRGAVAIGAIVLLACLFASLGFFTRSRSLLYIGQMFTMLAIVTELIFGLYIWYFTLQTKQNWARVWSLLISADEMATLQDRFRCCGYYDYATPVRFMMSEFCPDAATAASRPGCVDPFARRHARPLLGALFTGTFGMAVAAVLALFASFVYTKQCSRLIRLQRRRKFAVEQMLRKQTNQYLQ